MPAALLLGPVLFILLTSLHPRFQQGNPRFPKENSQYQFCLIFSNIISKSQFQERLIPVLIGKKSQQKRVFQESKMSIPF